MALFSYSRTSIIFVIFVPKKILFHLIPFIYGTPESFSIYAFMEQYRFRRLFQTNTRRQTSPPATATVTVHSQRQTESPTSPKSGSMLAPHFELNELDARVTPCELHARYRLHRNKYLHGNMRWKTLTDNYSMLSFAPFYNFKIFVRNC